MNTLVFFIFLLSLASSLVHARLPSQCCNDENEKNCLPKCVRKSYNSLSPEDWKRLGDAFISISNSKSGEPAQSFLSQIAGEHAAFFAQVHKDEPFLFFPYHRLLLAEIEMKLSQAFPGTCLPYFDYVLEKDNLLASPLLHQNTLGSVNAVCEKCINDGVFKDIKIKNEHLKTTCIQRCFPKSQADFLTRIGTLLQKRTYNDVINPPFSTDFDAYSRSILSSHALIHFFFSNTMISGASPFDPAFFFLHS
ncbi:hypothetical protein HMI55_001665, partial [Coelomomyces lativittatus]